MFRKILIPAELTGKPSRAMEIACQLCGHQGEITLLHVIEWISGAEYEDEPAFYQRLEQSAQDHLRQLVDSLPHAQQAMVRTAVVYGKRIREILSHTVENEIDLIVIPSHRIDREDLTEGWGTLSYQMGILAPCPVLLVK